MLRWWRERRSVSADSTSSTAYTDARIAAILAAAGGDAATDINAVAAAEVASGMWGRAMASAAVAPSTAATRALTAPVLELIGRELVRKGEALFLLEVERGEAVLRPVSWWDTYGGFRPDSWEYQVTLAGPDQTTTMRVGADRVVHPRYATTPTEPWRGISPLAHSRTTSDLAAMLETRLSQDVTAAVGSLIPVPQNAGDTTELQQQLAGLRGKVALVPTTAAGWVTDGKTGAPRHDWRIERIGANPPSVLDMLRTNSARHVLAACGVPIELVEPSEGTGAREAFRRFLHASIAPVARMVEEELRMKLDTPGLSLSFDDLFAADVQGRARAWRSLAGPEASLEPEVAARLVGLAGEADGRP